MTEDFDEIETCLLELANVHAAITNTQDPREIFNVVTGAVEWFHTLNDEQKDAIFSYLLGVMANS